MSSGLRTCVGRFDALWGNRLERIDSRAKNQCWKKLVKWVTDSRFLISHEPNIAILSQEVYELVVSEYTRPDAQDFLRVFQEVFDTYTALQKTNKLDGYLLRPLCSQAADIQRVTSSFDSQLQIFLLHIRSLMIGQAAVEKPHPCFYDVFLREVLSTVFKPTTSNSGSSIGESTSTVDEEFKTPNALDENYFMSSRHF